MKNFSGLTLVLLALALIMTNVVGQSQGHSCGNTFFSTLLQLIPCRAAVAPFSPIPPSEACCNAIKALGQPCLCVIANGPPITGVDRNMAIQLPQKCSVKYDPCDVAKYNGRNV